MKWKQPQILILFNIALTVFALDIAVKGDKCSSSDKCSSEDHKTCSCEDDCHEYGTCCVDADKFPLMASSNLYQCRSKRIEMAVFAKRSCSDEFKGHRDVRTSCLEEDYDEADLLNHLLVSSSKTHTTYWNKHCGICNNEDEYDLQFWTVTVSCPSHHGDRTFSESFIRKNLSFHEETEEWGLKIDDHFILCSVKYNEPDFVTGKLKYCAPFMISSCPDNYTQNNVLKKCLYYHGERRSKRTNQYYRNVHCAICNGVTLKELECSDRTYEEEDIFTPTKGHINVIFSTGSWIEKKGPARYKCSTNFQYNPLQNRCMRLSAVTTQPQVLTSGQNVIVPLYTAVIVALVLANKYL